MSEQYDRFACPTSLHDLQQEDVTEVPPSAQTPYACVACARPNFVIVAGVVICAACGSGTGMSVVATNVVQELRTANAEKNQGLAQLLELIIELSEQFARAMPLAKPQIDTIVRVSRAKLLELKL